MRPVSFLHVCQISLFDFFRHCTECNQSRSSAYFIFYFTFFIIALIEIGLVPFLDFTFLPLSQLHWMEPDLFLCKMSLFNLFLYCTEWNVSRSSARFYFFALFTIALNRTYARFHCLTFFIIALNGIGLVPLPDFTVLPFLQLRWMELVLVPLPDFTCLCLPFSLLHWVESVSFLCLISLFYFTFFTIALNGMGLIPLPDFIFLPFSLPYCVEFINVAKFIKLTWNVQTWSESWKLYCFLHEIPISRKAK